MKKIIKTKLHIFTIHRIEDEATSSFEIVAKCIADKTKSSITNMNFILSYLVVPFFELQQYETTIEVDNETCKIIYANSIALFNDIEWLNLLEIAIEDDKNAGEWEK